MKNTNILVKKSQTYCILLLALLFCTTANAKVNNYVGAYATLGEWSLLPFQSDYTTSFGVNGGLGFLYELQAGPTYGQTRFLFDVGLGAAAGMTAFLQSSNATQSIDPANAIDRNGDRLEYVYEVQDRKDNYNDIALQIPLMVGVQHKKFYMLAGVKVYYHAFTWAKSKAVMTTYGKYSDLIGSTFIGDLRNMPENQFFSNVPISKTNKNASLSYDLDLSFEIGGRFGIITDAVGYDVPKRKIEYRLAAFVDYGLLDLHHSGDQPALITPSSYNASAYNPDGTNTSMIDGLLLNDIMSTSGTDEKGNVVPFAKSVNNLMIGLKFTVLFQLPEPGQCVICRDSYQSLVHRGGGRRGMKYEE